MPILGVVEQFRCPSVVHIACVVSRCSVLSHHYVLKPSPLAWRSPDTPYSVPALDTGTCHYFWWSTTYLTWSLHHLGWYSVNEDVSRGSVTTCATPLSYQSWHPDIAYPYSRSLSSPNSLWIVCCTVSVDDRGIGHVAPSVSWIRHDSTAHQVNTTAD